MVRFDKFYLEKLFIFKVIINNNIKKVKCFIFGKDLLLRNLSLDLEFVFLKESDMVCFWIFKVFIFKYKMDI